MIASQISKLESCQKQCLSLGITADGQPRPSLGVPWESTTSAFNMCIPDLYLAPEDTQDSALLERLGAFEILGCYIFTPLSDYRFLSRFPLLRDLYIEEGQQLTSLAFARELEELSMLFLENAHLPDLTEAFPPERFSRIAHRCLGLYHCRIDCPEAISSPRTYFAELLIWPQLPDEQERLRWKQVHAGTFRYYQPRQKQ